MKRLLLIVLVCLAVPSGALAAGRDKSDGTLNVTSARGVVVVAGRGVVIGRVATGSVSVVDLTPNDDSSPYVVGWESFQTDPITNVTTYKGTAMRFRVVGGAYRVVVSGRGIDVVAVGQGTVRFPALTAVSDGRFSLDGGAFQDVPDVPFTGTFGATAASGG